MQVEAVVQSRDRAADLTVARGEHNVAAEQPLIRRARTAAGVTRELVPAVVIVVGNTICSDDAENVRAAG